LEGLEEGADGVRRGGKRGRTAAVGVALSLLALAPPAVAQQGSAASQSPCPQGLPDAGAALPPPIGARIGGYREDDFGGFRNVLPPGSNGLANACDLVAFMADPKGTRRPRHNNDQLGSPDGPQQQSTAESSPFKGYGNLVFASPGLDEGSIADYFKDASFGVRLEDRERTYSLPPRKVSVVRDKGFGVPHVYGDNRNDAMFGLGYVAAEDRLFLIDVLRHAGRAELSSFVGGTRGNRKMDQEQWRIAPYTEADLQRQLDQLDDLYGEDGRRIQNDVENYVDGVNRYIAEAEADRAEKMPSEYVAINRQGPEPWKGTDLVATASLVGGIFGKGGGRELDNALLLQAAQKRFKDDATGREVFDDFKRSEDPEAPTTAKGSFPYLDPPSGGAGSGSGAGLPTPGSVEKAKVSRGAVGSEGAPSPNNLPALGGLDRLRSAPGSASNALLVSGANTPSGHPVTVFGPQTSYFSPQILMEQDVHAPTLDARGAAFPGVNLYVQLGRGRDYAWSATSASQDITDTYAVDACDFDGDGDVKDGYKFRGSCEKIEHLERDNVWVPNAATGLTAGSERLVTERTKLGLVVGRGKIGEQEVLYTALRSTYRHEIDSARGFSDYNDPDKMKDAADFKRAAYKIGYTFNWFYTDDRHIAYFNSGNNPERPQGIDHNLPVRGTQQFEWRNFGPDRLTADYTPPGQHPQADDPPYLTSWNNKQAPDYRAADDEYAYGSVFRSEPLDDRIQKGIAGGGKIGLAKLIDAMEDAGTVDLRGDKVLPYLLKGLGDVSTDPDLAGAVAKLDAWQEDGAHRRAPNAKSAYEHKEAIAIMDAWWPRLLKAQFGPALDPKGTTPEQTDTPNDGETVDDDQTRDGDPLFKQLQNLIPIDNPPNGYGDHHGSSYRSGWYSYVEKDLRDLFEPGSVKGRFSRVYCGGNESTDGTETSCGSVLRSSLTDALAKSTKPELYGDEVCDKATKDGQARPNDQQVCFDAILHAPIGAITQPLINWVNRPTFQQAVEVQGHRSSGDGSGGGQSGGGDERPAADEPAPAAGAVLSGGPVGGCLPRGIRVGSRGIGTIRLGLNSVGLLLRAGVPARSTPFAFRYCVQGGGKVLVSLSRRGDARLVLATGRSQHARGVRPGDLARKIRAAYPRAYRLGPGLYGTRRSSRIIFRIRRGHVAWVAVADRRLIKDRRELAFQLSRIAL